MSKSKLLIIILVIVILITGGVLIAKNIGSNDSNEVTNKENETTNQGEEKQETAEVDIIDLNSNSRPYAIAVNNTPVAVKVQEGLNKAYLVYELPTEGYTSRVLALYRDIEEDLVIGTIRSARHNFIDYALESDAIFCCFGWSHYAEDELKAGGVDYLQGLYGGPYYRNNPENLATEHTAYTSMDKLKEATNSKGFRTTSEDAILLKYDGGDIDLSTATNVKNANTVNIPYGSAQKTTFEYDKEAKMYVRYQNGEKYVDYKTKEDITTKNIIVQKIEYSICDDNYYWDLKVVGSGEGYYITNGYAVPIVWTKENESSKTKYTYKSGTVIDGEDVSGQEITVSDGRTWIELQTTSQKLTIE